MNGPLTEREHPEQIELEEGNPQPPSLSALFEKDYPKWDYDATLMDWGDHSGAN